MAYIKYSLRRNRHKLVMIGWAAVGFILLFCILTVQLSATEGQSTTRLQSAKPLPAPALGTFNPIDEQATPLEQVEKPTSSNSKIPVIPDFLVTSKASQASHTFPTSSTGVDSVPPPSPVVYPNHAYSNNVYPNNTYTYETQNLAPNPAISQDAIYLQQSPATGDVIYQESRAMPRSNYFGVGPDEVCDEWSGFCKCKQKMFTRRGEPCSDKDCRARRIRNGDDCGCGN
jgi:hypothetical protein